MAIYIYWIHSRLIIERNIKSFTQERFNVRIEERGTQFNEGVEINKKENTVTYKVPAHNDVDQSDTLLDYSSVSIVIYIVFDIPL